MRQRDLSDLHRGPSIRLLQWFPGVPKRLLDMQRWGAVHVSATPINYCTAAQYVSCACDGTWRCFNIPGTPIILDTAGTGFQLTSAENGVRFDINGDGHPVQIAWTAPGSQNAWLALPHDGKVASGKDLFGDVTPQPPSDHPNGFLALAELDKPANGGNGDGIIDFHDSVWTNLRLWIDGNHDGISQSGELYGLPYLGVYYLGLTYGESKFTDEFGNRLRYKGRVNPRGQPPWDHVARVMYDVFLTMEQPTQPSGQNPQSAECKPRVSDTMWLKNLWNP